jgi:dipeptidyl aminopeptidase/acylaminoacyl peptidase
VLGLAIVAAFAAGRARPSAQEPAKKVLTIDDYTKWRSISSQAISNDGLWVIYTLQFANTTPAESKPVLYLLNLGTGQTVEIPNGTGAVFSPDSRWLAYQIDPGAGRGGRGGRGAGAGSEAPGGTAPPAPPPQAQGRGAATTAPARRAELRNLASGAVRSWQDVQSFSFSASSTHLMVRRRPPQTAAGAGRGEAAAPAGGAPPPSGAAPAAEAPAGPRGVDVTLHDLTTGRDRHLGSVNEGLFNLAGDLLAYTVDAAIRDANGLFVLELKTGRLHPLDNDAKVYSRLTWSDDGVGLAALKGLEVERMRERSNVLIVFPDVKAAMGDAEPQAIVLDPSKASGFPANSVVSDRAAISWSGDRTRVYFGIKEQVPAPDTRRRSTDENPDVDVWNSSDERIQSMQMVRAEADRNFTFRQAFDIAGGRFIRLTDETLREIDIAFDGKWAIGRDTRGYIHDYKRPAADLYRVDTTTGDRTLMLRNQLTGSGVLGLSADGRHFLYWKDNRIHAYDLDSGASRPLGGAAPPAFVNMEFNRPGPRPSYGVAGYTPGGRSVIVNQQFDVWELPLDGSTGRNLTNGAGARGEIRFRYVRTEPVDPAAGPGRAATVRQTIDLTRPITLSAYGEYTKKAGFYRLDGGRLEELVYEDASFSTPTRATRGETFLFTRQTFVEFPDLRVSGPTFKDARKITNVNPLQAEYRWGKRILFDFKNKDRVRLQGILALPDDYKPGEKRPMLVTFYEENSQNLHRYSAPAYLTGMGGSPIEAVSRGYITMLPDIHYRTGSSHSDMLECVEAAVKKVIEMGYVDPRRIAVSGHSYGGEGAAFIGTRSRMFAAVGVGAGVTDLFTDFSQSWGWSYQITGGSGANGNDYYLYGQGRWGFSPWDKPDVYHFESALTHVPAVTAPFLIMHGTADPTVSFAEGMNLYNALRYNGKKAVLLAYPNEGHGLRGLANRKDLTIKFFEFFDHYLKGAPAPKWLSEGVPFLKKGSAGG